LISRRFSEAKMFIETPCDLIFRVDGECSNPGYVGRLEGTAHRVHHQPPGYFQPTEIRTHPVRAFGDVVFQPDERLAADEQDVGRVEVDTRLLRVLVAALWRHRGDRALGVLDAEPPELVHLVDVDDAHRPRLPGAA
jgi:hypothetical protein